MQGTTESAEAGWKNLNDGIMSQNKATGMQSTSHTRENAEGDVFFLL